MIVLVLLALCTAGVTDLGAKATQSRSELRATTHPAGSRPADFGAVPIQSNALGHHLHVFLAKTCRSTVLAFLRTLNAGCDAGLKMFVGHSSVLSLNKNVSAHRSLKRSKKHADDHLPMCDVVTHRDGKLVVSNKEAYPWRLIPFAV